MLNLLRNWQLMALAGALLIAGVLHTQVRSLQSSNAVLIEKVHAQAESIQLLTASRQLLLSTLSAHQERTEQDAAVMQDLNNRIGGLHDYVEALEDRDAQCLSADDVSQLRNIWNHSSTNTSASSPATGRP